MDLPGKKWNTCKWQHSLSQCRGILFSVWRLSLVTVDVKEEPRVYRRPQFHVRTKMKEKFGVRRQTLAHHELRVKVKVQTSVSYLGASKCNLSWYFLFPPKCCLTCSEWKFQVITVKRGGITQLWLLDTTPEAALAGLGHDGDSYRLLCCKSVWRSWCAKCCTNTLEEAVPGWTSAQPKQPRLFARDVEVWGNIMIFPALQFGSNGVSGGPAIYAEGWKCFCSTSL